MDGKEDRFEVWTGSFLGGVVFLKGFNFYRPDEPLTVAEVGGIVQGSVGG